MSSKKEVNNICTLTLLKVEEVYIKHEGPKLIATYKGIGRIRRVTKDVTKLKLINKEIFVTIK